MPDRISLGYLTYGEHDPVRVLSAAARAGFHEMGVRLLPASPSHSVPVLGRDRAARQAFLAALRETDLRVGDIELVRLTASFDVHSLVPFFEIAAEFGGRYVLAAGDDRDFGRLSDNLAALCELASGFGMTIDVEFMPWTAVPDFDAACSLVESCGASNAGILIDALHFQKSRSQLREVKASPGSRLHYIQLCDGPADYDASHDAMLHAARHERLMPGFGDIDLVGLCSAMPENFVFSVEAPNDRRLSEIGTDSFIREAYASTVSVLKAVGTRGSGQPPP